MDEFKLSEFQDEVCSVPEKYDLFLGGGRGGAKSATMAILALRHAEQYGSRARILYIRKTYKGLADFETLTREFFRKAYGREASYNSTEHFWRLPNGAYFELGQLESEKDYTKYQGRSFTLLLVDEAGQYHSPMLLDRLRSNLRGAKDIPIRMVVAANPGGSGHQWLAKRFVFQNAKPWIPFYETSSEKKWIYAPSTYKDNPFIDQQQYKKQIRASLPTDEELLKAWLNGDWTVARGAYFGSVLEEKRNAVDPFDSVPQNPFEGNKWRHWIAHDYGSAAPSVTYVMAESPGVEVGGQFYPKDSIIIVDELATANPYDHNSGLGYTVPHLAELIKELCDKWDIRPYGCADDACFSKHGHSAGSIAEEFRREGINFRKARKGDRKSGWENMRTLLQDAGKPDKPGLYISRACEYFWQTVPYLGRDKRDPEDLDTEGADHGADAVRYGINFRPWSVEPARILYG